MPARVLLRSFGQSVPGKGRKNDKKKASKRMCLLIDGTVPIFQLTKAPSEPYRSVAARLNSRGFRPCPVCLYCTCMMEVMRTNGVCVLFRSYPRYHADEGSGPLLNGGFAGACCSSSSFYAIRHKTCQEAEDFCLCRCGGIGDAGRSRKATSPIRYLRDSGLERSMDWVYTCTSLD